MLNIQPSPAMDTAKKELRQLRLRLTTTRMRMLVAQAGAGKTLALALLIGGMSVEMGLDWLVHLPWLARACFSLPVIGSTGWIVYREVLLPLVRMPSDHAVACAIERAVPVFQTRLIASIQLARQDGAKKSSMVRALIRETAAMAATLDFRAAASMEMLKRALRMLGCAVALAGVVAWLGWGNMSLLIERALLLTARLPTRTRIEKIVYPAKIAAGDDLNIYVDAAGVIPVDGKIDAQAGGTRSEYTLEGLGGGRFRVVVKNPAESMTFVVHLGDATSDVMTVRVISPPVVLGVKCVEEYPGYTNLPPVDRPTGDMTLLAGSMLRLEVTAGSRVVGASAHLAGVERDVPLTVDAKTGLKAMGTIPIPKAGLTGFSLRLVDADGIASREMAVYQIEIVPDRAPTIKITQPEPNELATTRAEEVIAFNAEDDFGIAQVLLHYIVNHGAEKVIDFDMGGTSPRELTRRFIWKVDSLKLAPGGVIEYWMEAVDGNDVTGPGRGQTERAQIKIVTDEEKRAELAARTNETLDSLDDVSQNEETLAKKVGAQIFQKQGGDQP
jgi:hypothetical protein